MGKSELTKIFESTNDLTQVVVDELIFEEIFQKATDSKVIFKSNYLYLVKYVATAIVLLIALNLFSILKIRSISQHTNQYESPSKQLAEEFNLNR